MATTLARVFIVDDHPVVRTGFRRLLDHLDIAIAGEAASGEEALVEIASTNADLAIVDIAMRGMDGIELTRRLKQEYPGLCVLIVSMYEGSYYVRNALAAGADGYILKDNANELLAKAIDAVLAGRPFLCNNVRRKIG